MVENPTPPERPDDTQLPTDRPRDRGIETGAPGKGTGGLPPHYKWPMACLGGCIALLGAANGEPLIVAIGVVFVGAVLGLSFTSLGDWFKWLK